MTVTLHSGVDVRAIIDDLPPVDAVICSPPFLALRNYGTGHAGEIGQEANPAVFLGVLLDLANRLAAGPLAAHGSIAFELGDTYSGSGGAGGDYNEGGLRDGQAKFAGSARKSTGHLTRVGSAGWPRPKSLCGIPTLFAWSLAYGRNLLDPTETFEPWIVRNVIVWARPNPAVGELGDKVRPATSYITIATRSPKRWFDLDAVRAPGSPNTHARAPLVIRQNTATGVGSGLAGRWGTLNIIGQTDSGGAPPLDYWTDEDDHGDWLWDIPTEPSSLPHFAMWPSKLADRLVRMLVPPQVCTTCGEPRRRLTQRPNAASTHVPNVAEVRTVGWSTCGHDTWRTGCVLDPFAGAGTTLAVADLADRDAIGVDLNPNLTDLYPLRLVEVRRKLYAAAPEIPGQLALLGD